MDGTCNTYFTDTFGILAWIIQHIRHDALTPLMKWGTGLGNGKLLMLLAATFYWIWNQAKGKILLYAFAWSVIISALLKYAYTTCRPSEILWIGTPDGFSFPSGHTMVGAAVWFGLAYFLQNTALRVLCVFIALFIGFSRMYLGVHFPMDVLGGMSLGLLVLASTIYASEHHCPKWAQIPFIFQTATMLILLLAISFFSEFFQTADPHQYAIKGAGALFGLWFGAHFMAKLPERALPLSIKKMAGQFILGCFGIGLLWGIVKVLPFPNTDLVEWVDIFVILVWLQYALIGFWIAFGAPRLFDKFVKH